uniref:Uncharacterized protein n=1 Tax=Aegilops tauschii TaxID=37682 RepID=M8B0Q1_AEGTA
MVHEILLKLPTKDVIRCCCVSKLWRSVVADPTFRTLHADGEADHVSSAAPDALLVTVTQEPSKPDETSFFRVSSPRPTAMPHRVTIPSGYRLSNVCNGLLCFSLVRDCAEAAPFIYNPVTATFSPFYSIYRDDVDQSVFTLDGAAGSGGWRQRSFRSQCPLLLVFRPLLIQGKLYLVTTGQTRPEKRQNPGGLIEVDVATEACRTHRLPFEADEYHPLVNACEMSGRLCLAVDIVRAYETIVRKIQFWVLIPSPRLDRDDSEAHWELRYSFHADGDYVLDVPRSAWFDDTKMTLCYKDYELLELGKKFAAIFYKWDTVL